MKKLGIYMETASANLIEFTLELLQLKIGASQCLFVSDENHTLQTNEIHLEYKEDYLSKEYFQKLSDYVLQYDEVVLFGKPNVITQLFKSLSSDNRFYKIIIATKPTKMLTTEQQNDFVTDYFLLNKL
ncbi:hypothetical protein [Flavobacterium sp. N1994]|uniref:hypothetical protein n=1 Tax=Flavobacterium sp. N1994 TaxID=2986827 RepID=UPI0022237971|nr:hypothetical protein [Flavobacterium sp. N1994]